MGKELSRAEFDKRSLQEMIDLGVIMILTMFWAILIVMVFMLPPVQDDTDRMCASYKTPFNVESNECMLYGDYAFTDEELDILLNEPIRPKKSL